MSKLTALLRRWKAPPPLAWLTHPMHRRKMLADQFLRGSGIEIGALHSPMPLPRGRARARYVDRMTRGELALQYPDLGAPLMNVDIITKSEALPEIADASQDFVVASHVFEHMQDPIGALAAYCRILKPGGVILLIVPNPRGTFDRHRPETTFSHLVEDHERGTHAGRHAHFVEWVQLVEGRTGDDIAPRVRQLMDMDYSIHFHCWQPLTFLAFLEQSKQRYALPFHLTFASADEAELTCICRRD
jgi:SAM-dependent methyltransferase